MAASLLEQGLGGALLFVLAAVVGPEEFGLVVLAGVLVAFLQIFLEQGLGSALIQRPNLREEEIDSAFWGVMVMGVALYGCALALSSWWASANGAERLQGLFSIMALSLPLGAATTVQEALLRREMRFKSLAGRSAIAVAVGAVVGFGGAFAGWGAWALVAQELSRRTASLVVLWSVGTWRPKLRFSWASLRRLAKFSLSTLVGRLGVYANRRAEVILLGLFVAPVAVGLYRFADRLMNLGLDLTSRPVSAVSLPYLSRLQHDSQAFRGAVRRNLRLAGLLCLPALAAIASAGPALIAALPAKWGPAALPLQLLCLVGAAQAVTLITGPALNALGRPLHVSGMLWLLAGVKVVAMISVLSLARDWALASQIVLIAAVQLSVFWIVYVPVNVAMLLRAGAASPADIAAGLAPGLAIGVVVFGAGHGIRAILHQVGASAVLTAAVTVSAVAIISATGIVWVRQSRSGIGVTK